MKFTHFMKSSLGKKEDIHSQFALLNPNKKSKDRHVLHDICKLHSMVIIAQKLLYFIFLS